MLTEICAEIRNYFVKDIHNGTFQIVGGEIEPLDFLKEKQYFRIVGSTLNDGVYQYPPTTLVDETFEGSVWAMAVPPSVVALADEIKQYVKSDAGKPSNFTSESFGGYSYSKATDSNGAPLSWEKVFAGRLNKYRRMSVL
jgi:hypothetical protein